MAIGVHGMTTLDLSNAGGRFPVWDIITSASNAWKRESMEAAIQVYEDISCSIILI